MARWLKRGMDASAIKAADAKVRETVEAILAQVEERKDEAIRELSQKFDNWSPATLQACADRRSERAIAQVAKRDSTTSASRRRRCAISPRSRRTTHARLEVETLPGVVLGHRHIPVNSVGCYVPGGQVSAAGLGPHVDASPPRSPACKRVIACAPPFKGKPAPGDRRGHALAGADEIYVLGGIQAIGRHGARHRNDRAGRHARRPGQCLRGGGQAAAVRPRRHRPVRRARPRRWSSPTRRVDAEMCATDLLGQAEHGPNSPAILLTTSEKLARETMARGRAPARQSCRRAEIAAQGLGRLRRGHRLRRRGRDGARVPTASPPSTCR